MKVRGFTLIELMIVVVVIAIIAAIALPSYQSQIQKTRRADAQSALLQAAQALERCFTRTNDYSSCADPNDSPDGFYEISFDGDPTTTTFKLQAVPQGPQANDKCGTFTLTHQGIRDNNPKNTSDRCWGS